MNEHSWRLRTTNHAAHSRFHGWPGTPSWWKSIACRAPLMPCPQFYLQLQFIRLHWKLLEPGPGNELELEWIEQHAYLVRGVVCLLVVRPCLPITRYWLLHRYQYSTKRGRKMKQKETSARLARLGWRRCKGERKEALISSWEPSSANRKNKKLACFTNPLMRAWQQRTCLARSYGEW